MKESNFSCPECGKKFRIASDSIVGDLTYKARINLPLYWHVATNKKCAHLGKKKIRGIILYSGMLVAGGIVGSILEVLRFVGFWVSYPIWLLHEYTAMY